eukprot:c17088_g1_i1 orf=145-2337(+)
MSLLREKGRTFALDMGSDGASSLQKVILKKLTEFMGDYTDDVLAQYILVLVAHGKQQAQAAKDLEAFLGDQSESFVAWLWDYLCSNLHLHASVSKASVMGGNGMEQDVEQTDNRTVKGAQADVQVPSSKHEQEEKLTNDSSSARFLPDLNGPPPRIGNSEYGIESDKLEVNERNGGRHSRHTAKRPRSPMDTLTQKERKKSSDVKQHHKRHMSPRRVNATRRLLQSAVREAVAPVAGLTKSGSNRLRSVVSTDVDNFVTPEGANKLQTYKDVVEIDDVRQGRTGVPTALTDSDAAATAPQSAMTARRGLAGSVWDRLGRTAKDKKEEGFESEPDSYSMRMGESRFLSANTHLDDEGSHKKVTLGQQFRLTAPNFARINGYAAEETMFRGLANICRGGQHQANVRNDAKFLDDTHSEHLRVNDNQQDSVTMQYQLAKSIDTEWKQVQKVPFRPASSHKHVVCSQGQEPRTSQMELLQTQAAKVEGDSHKYVLDLKKRLDHVQMEMMKLRAKQSESNKEPQNASSSTFLGTEQVQKTQDGLHKRTVFVTNIHFAATKESIMAHFAQCGKIEQVVMLTDGATGKPKGSAYVEFCTPVEAEKALALNETSFYSRILKVVLTDASIIQEMPSTLSTSIRHPNPLPLKSSTRGRIFRGSSNVLPGFPSMRGAYATPTKMQWKRDSNATGGSPSAVNGSKPGVGVPVRSIAKSFTYVRNLSVPGVKEGTVEGQKGAT